MGQETIILIVEAMMVYFLVLWAHSLRHKFGPVHFYALIGGLTAIMSWVTDAGVAIQVGEITFVVGSTVFYTSLILGVFVVYVFDGPRATIIVISTIAGVSVMVPIIATTIHVQMGLIDHPRIPYVPLPSLRINAASVISTLIDLFFLAMVWEFLGKPKLNLKLWLQAFLTLLGVMWLDVILFSTGAFAGTPVYLNIMKGTLISRLIISVFAFPFLCGYLYWQNKKAGCKIENRPVLAILKQFAEIEDELSLIQEEVEQRKKTESALRESEKRYRSIFQNEQVMMLVIDPENGKLADANPAAVQFYGWSYEELIRMKISDINVQPPEEISAVIQMIKLKQQNLFHFQHRLKDGTVRDVDVTSGPMAYKGKTLLFSIVHDVTKRKMAEEALRESEEKYRNLVEESFDGIFIQKGPSIIFANKRLNEMLGYGDGELIGQEHWVIYHPEFQKLTRERAQARMRGEGVLPRYEVKLQRKDRSWFYGEINARQITFPTDQERGIQVWVRDIDERKRAEEEKKRLEGQLQQAQKMESIGTLAGGIAHDFNNLLMAIQGRTSLMLINRDPSHPDFEHLKGIEGYVGSAADLTKQLLGFARGGKYEVRPTDLNELVKKETRMFGRTKKEITIREKYEENLWSVEVDRGQIQQVLLNFYVNAWQAMPAGGELYIKTQNATLDDNFTKAHQFEPGRYVQISITDTGIGMDKATRERIFDPFFTTKEMGRGTGLGLASAYGILKNHGGFINVYSEKGYGSTFDIYLPASETAVMEEKKPAGDILKGIETVLFVDDEKMVAEVAKDLLELLGYKVFVAASGQEAIQIYKENREQIALVILDMIMPNMSGSETYDRLKAINPAVKVLLSSGYSINGEATEILDRGCRGFLQKPFKIKELSQKLRDVLDEN